MFAVHRLSRNCLRTAVLQTIRVWVGIEKFDDQEAVMNRTSTVEKMLQYWVVVLLVLGIPALAWGQHKTSAPAPHASAPAQHASAPSHSSSPSHSTQSHTTPSHGATAGHTTTAGHGNTTSHTNTASHANTSHGNTNAGHTTTASHGNTTAGHANTAGHTNTASHGNTKRGARIQRAMAIRPRTVMQALTEIRQPMETRLQAGAMPAELLRAGRSR